MQTALVPTGNRKPDLGAHCTITCTLQVIICLNRHGSGTVAVEFGNCYVCFEEAFDLHLHLYPEDEDSKFSEKFVTTYQIKLCNKYENHNLELHPTGNFKSVCQIIGFLGRKDETIRGLCLSRTQHITKCC